MRAESHSTPPPPIAIAISLAFFFAVLALFWLSNLVSPAGLAALYIICIYLITHPRIFYHPANVVFANYAIYFILPYSLWSIYKIFEIEYLLPWGMINDWSKLSDLAIINYAFLFSVMYISALYFCESRKLKISFEKMSRIADTISIRESRARVFFLINIVCVFVFIELSGGWFAWINNYSQTYLLNREGLGVLNLYILWTANFSAFLLGYNKFILNSKLTKLTFVMALLALTISIFAQGIKSRIPMLLFFYFASYLAVKSFKISIGFIYFIALIAIFMLGMYFRSDGFYNTPQLLLEYLQSYFNTIFLHDIVLSDYRSGDAGSLFMGFNKYRELIDGKIPRESYDLAVLLTQKYFPDQWYIDGGTQQWPLETDLFLTFTHPVFWIAPVLIYSLCIGILFRNAHRYNAYLFYIYSAELIRLMSIFRSGFLPWDLGLTIFSYLFLYMFWIILFKRSLSPINVQY
jgi:hypothetical protein